jgi:hypothetical protein
VRSVFRRDSPLDKQSEFSSIDIGEACHDFRRLVSDAPSSQRGLSASMNVMASGGWIRVSVSQPRPPSQKMKPPLTEPQPGGLLVDLSDFLSSSRR